MHRRQFLTTTTVTGLAAGFPAILGATNKSGTANPIFKAGDRSYECIHDCFQLPTSHKWQTSHGICFDAAGSAYVIMQGNGKTPPVETIHVFDAKGQYVRSFGKEYYPGGHGIDVRKEQGEEFLYICDIAHNQVIKTNLRGEQVWKLDVPQEAKVYPNNKGYKPTNVAFGPDGGFFIGDGYGSSYIHQYTAGAKYVRTFGGPGTALGKLKTPHGLWFDPRPGRQGLLAVADRENGRIEYFAPTGEAIGILPGMERPCNVDYFGDLCVIPELNSRVTLLGKNNEILARFGEEKGWKEEVTKKNLRTHSDQWPAGKFIHPHDATFDAHGNIYVVEWVETGRITKLKVL